MARYGSFKYGAQKYGTDTNVDTIQWGFTVDWDGDGYFTGGNEAPGRLIDLMLFRGRDNFIKPNGSGLERYQPGEVIAIFDNSDGRYDPYNTLSPLYPNVMPSRLVDIKFRDKTGSIRSIMRGKIINIENYRRAGIEVAAITVKDGLQFLNDQTLTIGLKGRQVDELVNEVILVEAGWPNILFRGWPIWEDTSTRTIQQWAMLNKNALQAVNELEDVELGQFFHTRDGYGRFVPSTYTFNSTQTITEEMCLRDISFPMPWEVVRNEIVVTAYPRKYAAVNAVVFSLNSPVAIANGETVNLVCEFSYASLPTIGQFPTYTIAVNTASNGSGINITSSCTILTDSNPGYASEVQITNNSGSDGYIVTLTIQVQNVSYVVNPVTVVSRDESSQAIYGKRVLVIDSPVMDSITYAKSVADWLLSNLKDPQPWPVIQLENRSDFQFTPDLYITRIRLQAPTKNIDAYYRVGKIEHRWLRENGQAIRTTFKLEPYFTPFTNK